MSLTHVSDAIASAADFFTDDDSSNKNLWRYLTGRRQYSCGVSTLVSKGRVGLDSRTKADMLNCQFSSV